MDRDVHVSRGSLEMVLSLAVFTPLPKKRKKVKSYNKRTHHHSPPALSLSLPNIPPSEIAHICGLATEVVARDSTLF